MPIVAGTHGHGIVLQHPSRQNPVTVAAGGYVTNQGTAGRGDAIYGTGAAAWDITNFGTVLARQPDAAGILLEAGGTIANYGLIAATGTAEGATALYLNGGSDVDNAASGVIAGGSGIRIGKTGTVANLGTIAGTSSVAYGVGVYIRKRGVVSNGDNGAGAASILGYEAGIRMVDGTVTNFATIAASGTSGDGVDFEKGGDVTNQAGGLVEGAQFGIGIGRGAGTVVNLGEINATSPSYATSVYLGGGGSVVNLGTIDALGGGDAAGVGLARGGTIENGQSGSAAGLIAGSEVGVVTGGGAASLVNYGTILGSAAGVVSKALATTVVNSGLIASTAYGYGVYLYAGGQLANLASGTIDGYKAVLVSHAAATMSNFGTVTGRGPNGVGVDLLTAGNTLVNAGTISGTGGAAFSFGNGDDLLVIEPGSVLDGAVARFQPLETIDLAGVTATRAEFSGGTLTLLDGSVTVADLVLTGRFNTQEFVLGPDGAGGTDITLRQPQRPQITGVYYDTVLVGAAGIGVAATVAASGTIEAAFGHGIRAVGGLAGMVLNTGTIEATETPTPGVSLSLGDGIYLNAGGTVINQTGGLIAGSVAGVDLTGGNGTITNAGTIVGSGGTAVMLGGGDRLVVDVGAAFQGIADGGGGSVLELAGPQPGTGGGAAASLGTLAGIGSSFVNFGTLAVDAGAAWEAAGNAAAYVFVNDGTILVSNGIAAGGEALVFGALGEDPGQSGIVELGQHGTAQFAGSVDPAQTLVFTDETGLLQLADPAEFSARISGFASGDVIDLVGIAADDYTYAKGQLTLLEAGSTVAALSFIGHFSQHSFQLTPDGVGGTDLTLASGAEPAFLYQPRA